MGTFSSERLISCWKHWCLLLFVTRRDTINAHESVNNHILKAVEWFLELEARIGRNESDSVAKPNDHGTDQD